MLFYNGKKYIPYMNGKKISLYSNGLIYNDIEDSGITYEREVHFPFTVMDWNIAGLSNWSIGGRTTTDNKQETTIPAVSGTTIENVMKGFISETDNRYDLPDIMFIEEYSTNFDKSGRKTDDVILGGDEYYHFKTPATDYWENTIHIHKSVKIISEEATKVWLPKSNKQSSWIRPSYTFVVVEIDGKQIALACTHFYTTAESFGDPTKEFVASACTQIVQDLQDYEYVIIAGDFNTQHSILMMSKEELSEDYINKLETKYNIQYYGGLGKNGYTCLDGQSKYYASGLGGYGYVDNIITKGLNFDYYLVIDSGTTCSDHPSLATRISLKNSI